MADAPRSTKVRAPFAGRERDFCLRIGEIGELERICNAGVGAIMLRLAQHQFYAVDIWEVIRLGLEGGGAPEIEASALVLRYKTGPLADYVPLACDIISAAVTGVVAPGKTKAEGTIDPATSPPSTARAG